MSIRSIIQIVLTLALVCFVLFNYEIDSISQGLGKVPLSTYVLALTLIASTLFLSSVRFFLLLHDLRVPQSFASSFYINAMSLLGNLVLFNYFGQSLTRYSLLSHVDRSPAMAFILTGLERAVALVSLFIMALISAFWLFGSVHIEFNKAGPVMFLFFNLFVVFLGVTWFGVRRQLTLIRRVSLSAVVGPLLRISFVTIIMHLSMLGAFLVLARELASDASPLVLGAVSTIVMLAAALPISFAGWGVRELSAAYTFAFVGLVPESGLTMSVAVGLISLIALAIKLILAFLLKPKHGPVPLAAVSGGSVSHVFTKLVSWGIPVFVAALIVFQARLVTHTGWVTFNLADPFAIVGGIIFALLAFTGRGWKNVWKIQGINVALILITGVMGLAFLHGWAMFGVTEWALYNRLVGWLLLLCYLLTGALIARSVGSIGLRTIARVYLVSCVVIISLEIVVRLGASFVGLDYEDFYTGLVYSSFSGMIGNPNAFGLQLVLAMSLGLSGQYFWVGRYSSTIQHAFLGVIFAGIVFTGSRASALALIIIVCGSLLLRRSNIRQLLSTVGVGAAVVLLVLVANHISMSSGGSNSGVHPEEFFSPEYVGFVYVDRWESMVVGWEMFVSHPIFGAGLGAYMEDHLNRRGFPHVIHSSYLWLLAEFGIVGFIAFLTVPANVVQWIWRNWARRWEWDWTIIAGIGCLVTFGFMSLVHELVYQRIVWFMCGVLFAIPKSKKSTIGFQAIKEGQSQVSVAV